MKRWWRIASVVVMVGFVYGATLALASFVNDWCGNTTLERVSSPDGQHVAVLFARNCGATTDFSSHVSLLGAGEALPNGAGNVFVAALASSGARAAWGGPPVALRWLDSTTLQIRPDPAEVVLAAVEHGGTRIDVDEDG